MKIRSKESTFWDGDVPCVFDGAGHQRIDRRQIVSQVATEHHLAVGGSDVDHAETGIGVSEESGESVIVHVQNAVQECLAFTNRCSLRNAAVIGVDVGSGDIADVGFAGGGGSGVGDGDGPVHGGGDGNTQLEDSGLSAWQECLGVGWEHCWQDFVVGACAGCQ